MRPDAPIGEGAPGLATPQRERGDVTGNIIRLKGELRLGGVEVETESPSGPEARYAICRAMAEIADRLATDLGNTKIGSPERGATTPIS